MLKRAVSLILMTLLMCNIGFLAFAHEVPDTEAFGSITVHLKSGEEFLESGALTFYRVGEIVREDGNDVFRLTDEFADCGETLEDIHDPDKPARLADYVTKQNLSGVTAQIKNGTVSLNLSKSQLGLYLAVQSQMSEGWQTMNPFLVSVPNMEEGEYVYHVDATPKVGVLQKEESEPEDKPEEGDKDEEDQLPESTPTEPGLPQTGQLNWPIPVLTAFGLGLFAVGWMLRFREERTQDET